jgi:hypothetical protein
VANSVFKKEHVEEIAEARMAVCFTCQLYTQDDAGCMVAGTAPCCDERQGGCGCSLKFKIRSLSSECPLGKWKAELTQEEEDKLNQKLNI